MQWSMALERKKKDPRVLMQNLHKMWGEHLYKYLSSVMLQLEYINTDGVIFFSNSRLFGFHFYLVLEKNNWSGMLS